MVLCEACDFVDPDTLKQGWRRTRCLASPLEQPHQFVVEDPFLVEPPFELCRFVNPEGNCALYEPRKESENDDNE